MLKSYYLPRIYGEDLVEYSMYGPSMIATNVRNLFVGERLNVIEKQRLSQRHCFVTNVYGLQVQAITSATNMELDMLCLSAIRAVILQLLTAPATIIAIDVIKKRTR
mmetsp:Transcript_9473/g.14207  ORF Transcript_9473/g.14207 Transcript_9473/m.14207 type:complete len:107 (-) Transcript_9473:173-493(-)